ncbi:MAG: ATP-binding protein [Chloroflexi bacterium]|nr:ATP-binding protein [Chloroflexota bacterium]
MVRQVVGGHSHTLRRHAIQLTIQTEPLLILGEARRLYQVLEHLLQNAVKFSPHGSAIEIQLGRNDTEAWLRVRDHGIGIPPAAQQLIFDRFYRADNFNHLQISGFGVGLYLVREIITQHAGRIVITSIPDQGSTFDIYLPLVASL